MTTINYIAIYILIGIIFSAGFEHLMKVYNHPGREDTNNKQMKKILEFIRKECWLGFMMAGICLMTWAISQGEGFVGHIPLAGVFI